MINLNDTTFLSAVLTMDAFRFSTSRYLSSALKYYFEGAKGLLDLLQSLIVVLFFQVSDTPYTSSSQGPTIKKSQHQIATVSPVSLDVDRMCECILSRIQCYSFVNADNRFFKPQRLTYLRFMVSSEMTCMSPRTGTLRC